MRQIMVMAYRLVTSWIKDCAIDVVIREHQKQRTDPQRRTLWMWHGQVASELTVRTGKRWTKDDVHELIFLARWMPYVELPMPDGKTVRRPMRTSEKAPEGQDDDPRSIISNAMTQYIAWICEMGIEVTVPDPLDWQAGTMEKAA